MDKVRRIASGVRNYHLADARPEYWEEIDYIRQALKSQSAVSFLFEPGNPADGGGMEILMVPMDACINYGAWRGAGDPADGGGEAENDWVWLSVKLASKGTSQIINTTYLNSPDYSHGFTASDNIEVACLLNDIFESWPRPASGGGKKTTAEVSDSSRRQWYGSLYDRMTS